MQLTPETQHLLQSFAKINNSIVIKEGDVLSTISNSKAILAKAKMNQSFDGEMPIYDLSRFLSVLSLFTAPNLDLKESFVTITSDSKKLNYTFADKSLITCPPAKDIKLPSVDVEFTLSETDLISVQKAQGVLRLPEFAVVGDGKKIMFQTLDSKNVGSDIFSCEAGKTDKKFSIIFNAENIRVLLDSYKIQISSAGLSFWKGDRAEYLIAVESNSTFEK